MKNKKLFKIISIILAAWLPVLTACSATGGQVNYDKLEATIAEAQNEFDITAASVNGNNVPLGTYWVTFQVKDDFESDIATAKAALNSTSQTVVNKAVRDLADKIEEFKSARQPGTADPVNKTGLAAKIAEAEFEKLFVVVASSPEEVAQGRKYVSQSVMDTFETGITQAKNAFTSSSQDTVNTILNSLNMEITLFKYERKDGTKSSDFTQTELNDLLEFAKTIQEKIKTSNNGDDIGPAEYWVNQGNYSDLMRAFNNAVTAASNQTGNIDSVYALLVSAINTINTNKQLGSTANKNSLFDAIRAADTVKTGVVIAANASQAPSGYKWATQTQWSPFNAAYTNALNAARDPNVTKNDVTARTSALTSATSTFNSAVNNNGPGTRPNTITIDGLPYIYNGCQIDIYLFASPNVLIGEHQCYGAGTIQNYATGEIRLNPRSGTTWIGGSSYVVFVINNEPIQYYISKSAVHFTAVSNAVTSFTDYKKYAFKYTFGNIAVEMGVPSSGITLDEFYQYMEGMTYAQTLESGLLPGQLYKDEALTRPFSGGDRLNASTEIYCGFPLMGNRGSKIGVITGTITLTEVPSPTPLVYISVSGSNGYNQWNSNKSRINLGAGSDTFTNINWSIPIYNNDNFFASTGNFTLYVRPVGGRDESQINIPGTKNINSVNANVGNLGTVSINYMGLSVLPLTSNTWKNGSINSAYDVNWYSINVTNGNTYYLWWNDSYEGDDSKTLDIDVYAFNSGNNPIPLTFNETPENDSAWDAPVSFTASSTGKVTIRVRALDGDRDTGTYAIAYNTSGIRPNN
ncbi:hypothetical protein [Treponema sp. R80B11-R83G3]